MTGFMQDELPPGERMRDGGAATHTHRPAFDCTSELSRFTNLAALLVRQAAADARPHLEDLTGYMLSLIRTVDALQRPVPGNSAPATFPPGIIAPDCDASVRVMQHLQVTDRLSQRLENSSRILAEMATLIDDTGGRFDAAQWKQFLGSTRALFTTAEERRLFDDFFGRESELQEEEHIW